MIVLQQEIKLPPFTRGFHLITSRVLDNFEGLDSIKVGVFQIFLKHTSAGLTLNEDADPTVRADFESHFNEMVPERASYYKHNYEGDDDMPAHIKSSLLGSSIQIPITDGTLNLGPWQGIYLCEHRNHASSRKLVITAIGI